MAECDKLRILIVDDNPENLMVVASALSARNFSMMLARSGAEALACLERFSPDAVLLDIVMPEMNGFETCRRLKEKPGYQNVPVIFLTARNEQEDVLEGFKAGGADFISKPFNQEELFHRLEAHAQRFRLQLQLQKRNEALTREIELRKKRELQLSSSEKARLAGRFSAGISHHFNNMFQTILGYSELIESACQPESDIAHHIRQIVAATEKTSLIVDQLSHYLGDNRFGESTLISLNEVFSEVEVAFAAILPKNVNLTFSASRNCPEARFNRNDIIQALTNLIMNSVESMPETGGQVSVRASRVGGSDYVDRVERIDVKAEYIELAVADNGMGMEKSVLDRACEPFFTTQSNFAEKNGLGLSVVQGIMHASNGFIIIESEIGSGTLVKLLFPLAKLS